MTLMTLSARTNLSWKKVDLVFSFQILGPKLLLPGQNMCFTNALNLMAQSKHNIIHYFGLN